MSQDLFSCWPGKRAQKSTIYDKQVYAKQYKHNVTPVWVLQYQQTTNQGTSVIWRRDHWANYMLQLRIKLLWTNKSLVSAEKEGTC